MSSELMNPLPSFKPDENPETAFLRAQQVVDEREGSLLVRAYHWRVAALGSIGVSLVLSAGLIVQSTKARVEPYVVEIVNGERVRAIRQAAQSEYVPHTAIVKKALHEWLIAVRTVSSDPIVVRENWLRAYKFVSPKGKAQLDAFAQLEDPFSLVGKSTRSIQQVHINRIPNSQTYRVEWIEQTWSTNGAPQGDPQTYVGTHTLITRKPRTEQALKDNPLGVFVDGFEWSLLLSEEGASL